jgi:hypothetical protein
MMGWLDCPRCGGKEAGCWNSPPPDAIATLPWRMHVAPIVDGLAPETLTGESHSASDGPYVAIVGANGIVVADNATYYPKEITQNHAQMIVDAVNAKGGQP